MGTLTKLKPYPGVAMVGADSIDTHDTTEALRGAQRRLDMRIHDLRSEFIAREKKLQEQYLEEVAELTGERE